MSQPIHGAKLWFTVIASLLASMIVAAIIAVLVEVVAYRRLRAKGANRLASLISAIGVSIVLLEGMSIITGAQPRSAPRLLEKWSFGEIAGANFLYIPTKIGKFIVKSEARST